MASQLITSLLHFLFLSLTLLTLTSEASHPPKKLPAAAAVVVGTVYCDSCSINGASKPASAISGASVAVECRGHGKFRRVVKTNGRGEFRVELPRGVKKIQRCWVKLLSSSKDCAASAAQSSSSSMVYSESGSGEEDGNVRVFSAGYFTFKPSLCSEKPTTADVNQKRLPPLPILPRLPSLPPLPPLPTLPRLPFLPAWPGKSFTKPSLRQGEGEGDELSDQKSGQPQGLLFPPILPPNPLQPSPPSLPLPPNPLQPPSLVPPVLPPNPLQPPPAPVLPVPPIPGLTPAPAAPVLPVPPIPGLTPLPAAPVLPVPPIPGLPAAPVLPIPPIPGLIPSPPPPPPPVFPFPLPPPLFPLPPGFPGVPPPGRGSRRSKSNPPAAVNP